MSRIGMEEAEANMTEGLRWGRTTRDFGAPVGLGRCSADAGVNENVQISVRICEMFLRGRVGQNRGMKILHEIRVVLPP